MNSGGSIYLSGGMERAVEHGAQWRRDCSFALLSMNFLPLDIAELDQAYIKKHGPVSYTHLTLPTIYSV